MGAQIGAQKGENSEYVTAIHNLADFFNQRTIRPWLWSDALFNLTNSGRGFDRDLKILHGFTKKVIREKKQERLTQKISSQWEEKENEFQSKKRKAFMDLLLDLHLDGQQLSEQDIQEEVDTFMFEGHDTTAMGIAYAVYNIGLDPKIQDRVHEELDTIFGNDHERHVTMDDARNMKYLECVLKESQRLFPSVPIIGRKMNEDINYSNRPENQPDSTAWKAVRLTATTPMLQKMSYRFDLCSHDGCVCGDKGDPNHYATDYPLTKPFHFMKPGAENLSTWCENIVQNKRSLATTHEYYEDPT
ncbi:Cytochrome P450 4C1 [Araneus ventricosus]|uniref:Cytochrome P450 4C1 n=1 Tax=Araneus ventricosus TaxID=182803 RepID=A0A4Y2MX49_ARAVE|nr:Cytochrome P450 4C1 [Araneus ventricosus]